MRQTWKCWRKNKNHRIKERPDYKILNCRKRSSREDTNTCMQLKTAGPLFVHCTPITKLIFFQYLVYYYISRFRLLHKQLVLHKRLILYYASGCVTQAVKFLLRKRLLLHKQLIFNYASGWILHKPWLLHKQLLHTCPKYSELGSFCIIAYLYVSDGSRRWLRQGTEKSTAFLYIYIAKQNHSLCTLYINRSLHSVFYSSCISLNHSTSEHKPWVTLFPAQPMNTYHTGPVLMAEWSKALPLTSNCPSPLLGF